MPPGLRGKKSIIFYFLSSDIFFTMTKMFLKIQLVILTIIYRDTLEESPSGIAFILYQGSNIMTKRHGTRKLFTM